MTYSKTAHCSREPSLEKNTEDCQQPTVSEAGRMSESILWNGSGLCLMSYTVMRKDRVQRGFLKIRSWE